MSEIAGTEIGCVEGHTPARLYAMWLLWSALSSCFPFQQLGKLTWSRSPDPGSSGHAGALLDGGVIVSTPQFQNVTRRLCAVIECESPAIIFSPCGNGWT